VQALAYNVQGTFYPGIIRAYWPHSHSYTIQFDDGDKDEAVPVASIRK
jgi:hypothetical protein